jgi:hypothetical protein
MPIEPAATLPLTDDTIPLPTVEEPASVGIAAAALAAAVWVAIEEWQAQDGGREELDALIDQALGTVLGAPLRATTTPSTQ